MTQSEIRAFWSGAAANSKGNILIGSNVSLSIERITNEEIDEILTIVITESENDTTI